MLAKKALWFDLLFIVLVWHLLARWLRLPFLPGPLDVVQVFIIELPGEMWQHLLASGLRIVLGIAVGAMLAVPLAILTAQLKMLDQFFTPLVYLGYPVPKIIFLPLVMLFLGIGDLSKIFLIGVMVFFQVYVIVRDTAGHVRKEMLDSIRSLGGNRWHCLLYIYIPASTPALITALKISSGTALAVLFFTETFATSRGLGYYVIVESWSRAAYAQLYAGIVMIGLVGLSLSLVLEYLEKFICPWLKYDVKQDDPGTRTALLERRR